MVRKSVAFLVDRYDRGVTMSRGYGGFYLITTYFRAFLLFLSSFRCRSNCAAGEVARVITCVRAFRWKLRTSSSPAAKLEQRGVNSNFVPRTPFFSFEDNFSTRGLCPRVETLSEKEKYGVQVTGPRYEYNFLHQGNGKLKFSYQGLFGPVRKTAFSYPRCKKNFWILQYVLHKMGLP